MAAAKIAVGDRIPEFTFTEMTAEGPKPVTTAEVFSGKTVAFFSVPGAFTPTCEKQCAGFGLVAAQFKKRGAEVAVTAVNDAFVMGAWAEHQKTTGKLRHLADGNGDFARAVGLEIDGTAFGLGKRGARYGAIVVDGVITYLGIEAPGKLEVSTAEALLANLPASE